MDGNQFHYLKAGLESDGYELSNRRFLDWFTRSYIKQKCCPDCDHFGLEPIIFRKRTEQPEKQRFKQSFGKCPGCGEIHRI